MAGGLEMPGGTVGFDDGEEGSCGGDVEGLEGEGETAEEGGALAKDVCGAETESQADNAADGTPFDGVLVVGVFFFFCEDLHDCWKVEWWWLWRGVLVLYESCSEGRRDCQVSWLAIYLLQENTIPQNAGCGERKAGEER